jgi:hypothetical protein
MKLSECIEGVSYVFESGNWPYLGIYKGIRDDEIITNCCLNLETAEFFKEETRLMDLESLENVRIPTDEEVQWFNACIAANKAVNKADIPKINNNYEIF